MIEVPDHKGRAAVRLSGEYSLAWLRAAGARFGGDMVLGVIFLAVLRANIRDLTHLEARAPISVRALAASLDLPAETVRQQAARLARDGWVQRSDGGMLAVEDALRRPPLPAGLIPDLQAMLEGLYRLGDGRGPPDERVAPERADVALLLTGDYVLRFVAQTSEVPQGLMIGTLVQTVILQANVRHIMGDPDLTERYAAAPPPDEERRPISVTAVAQIMGMQREATRRRVNGNASAGYLRRVRGGIIVPRAALTSPEAVALHQRDLANLRRLLAQLREYGVLVPA